jgi:hypothetical protein
MNDAATLSFTGTCRLPMIGIVNNIAEVLSRTAKNIITYMADIVKLNIFFLL